VLAFDCATRQFHVCTVREDGTQFRGLTRKGRHPKWSPRGGLIASTRLDVLKPGILVFRTNGTLVHTLRNGSADPGWSPDGKWLVAEREVPGGPRLYATDASRASLARVTQGRYRDSASSWSPDGRSIVFRRFAKRSCSIAVVARRADAGIPDVEHADRGD
jgi:Tol biopolymer transport system component